VHFTPGISVETIQEPKERETHLERRERERQVWRSAFVISVGLHLLLILLWPGAWDPDSPFSAAGPRAMDDQAAEGMMQAVSLSSAPPDAAQPPPIPTIDVVMPDLVEVEIEPDALPEVDIAPPDLPEPGQGVSTGVDPDDTGPTGLPGQAGRGDAGTTDEGRFRMVPPSPRGMIIPPTNRGLRGQEIEVWVFVNEEGRVVADSTRLRPPTSDRRFNEQLIREAGQWVFRPAQRDGTPIGAWFPYTISM
jgi:hypothetical protein